VRPIPDRSQIAPVILDLLADGCARSAEKIREVATHFALTEKGRTRKRGRGPHPEYSNENARAARRLTPEGNDPTGRVC
jgi:hypothetical protein